MVLDDLEKNLIKNVKSDLKEEIKKENLKVNLKIYFITRFSILDYNCKAWVMTSMEKDNYSKTLFADDRLNAKFEAFEKMTLPSIVNQTNQNYEWLILTSNYLPQLYMNRLKKDIEKYPQIKLFTVENMVEFKKIVKEYPYQKLYATVRIDDDDGLNVNYVKLMQKYQYNDQCIITFPKGRAYKIIDKQIEVMNYEINSPMLALGLAAINMNIYLCGSHHNINQRYNVIYDKTPESYHIFLSPFCDTKRGFKD